MNKMIKMHRNKYESHVASIFEVEYNLRGKMWLSNKFIRKTLYDRRLPKIDQRILGDLLGAYVMNARKVVKGCDTYYCLNDGVSFRYDLCMDIDHDNYHKWDRETGY